MAKNNEHTRWQRHLDKRKKKENAKLIKVLSEPECRKQVEIKMVQIFEKEE